VDLFGGCDEGLRDTCVLVAVYAASFVGIAFYGSRPVIMSFFMLMIMACLPSCTLRILDENLHIVAFRVDAVAERFSQVARGS
jgi:hypothetical protein